MITVLIVIVMVVGSLATMYAIGLNRGYDMGFRFANRDYQGYLTELDEQRARRADHTNREGETA